MVRPQAVVFDLGRVLLDFDYRIATDRLAPCCALDSTELRRLLDQSPLLHRYESGQLTDEQFFAEFQSAAAFRGDFAAFAPIFGDIFTPIESMIRVHAELRARGVPTFVFSNTNGLAVRHIRRHYAFFGAFTGYVFSYEHGVMKPDARLYEVAEHRAGCDGSALFYVDDRSENVEVARTRGWQAVVHQSPEASRRALQAVGLIG